MHADTSSKDSVRVASVSRAGPGDGPARIQTRRFLFGAGSIAAALFLHTLALAELVDRQFTVLPLLFLFLAGVYYNRPVRFSYPVVFRFAAYFMVSLIVAVSPALLETGGIPVAGGLRGLGLVLLGWTLVVWLPLGRDVDRPTQEWLPTTRLLLFVMLTTLAAAALRHRLIVAEFAVLQDEVLYLLQSAWLANPGFGWQLDPQLLSFLRPEYTSFRDNILTTQYPPGWPALLAA